MHHRLAHRRCNSNGLKILVSAAGSDLGLLEGEPEEGDLEVSPIERFNNWQFIPTNEKSYEYDILGNHCFTLLFFFKCEPKII